MAVTKIETKIKEIIRKYNMPYDEVIELIKELMKYKQMRYANPEDLAVGCYFNLNYIEKKKNGYGSYSLNTQNKQEIVDWINKYVLKSITKKIRV